MRLSCFPPWEQRVLNRKDNEKIRGYTSADRCPIRRNCNHGHEPGWWLPGVPRHRRWCRIGTSLACICHADLGSSLFCFRAALGPPSNSPRSIVLISSNLPSNLHTHSLSKSQCFPHLSSPIYRGNLATLLQVVHYSNARVPAIGLRFLI